MPSHLLYEYMDDIGQAFTEKSMLFLIKPTADLIWTAWDDGDRLALNEYICLFCSMRLIDAVAET